MSTSSSARPVQARSTAALHLAGSLALTTLGVAHLGMTLFHVCVLGPSPDELPTFEWLRATTRVIAGLSRNMFQLMCGFSLATGAFALFFGLLNVAIAKYSAQRGDPIPPPVLAVNALASLTGLTLAILFLPPVPIFLFAVATFCFCAAVHRAAAYA